MRSGLSCVDVDGMEATSRGFIASVPSVPVLSSESAFSLSSYLLVMCSFHMNIFSHQGLGRSAFGFRWNQFNLITKLPLLGVDGQC